MIDPHKPRSRIELSCPRIRLGVSRSDLSVRILLFIFRGGWVGGGWVGAFSMFTISEIVCVLLVLNFEFQGSTHKQYFAKTIFVDDRRTIIKKFKGFEGPSQVLKCPTDL